MEFCNLKRALNKQLYKIDRNMEKHIQMQQNVNNRQQEAIAALNDIIQKQNNTIKQLREESKRKKKQIKSLKKERNNLAVALCSFLFYK